MFWQINQPRKVFEYDYDEYFVQLDAATSTSTTETETGRKKVIAVANNLTE